MSLAAHMRVSALLHFCGSRGEGAYVVRKGDPVAGALLVRHARSDRTIAVYARRYDFSGAGVWDIVIDTDQTETADSYVERRVQTDPDIWVIEVETRSIDDALALI